MPGATAAGAEWYWLDAHDSAPNIIIKSLVCVHQRVESLITQITAWIS